MACGIPSRSANSSVLSCIYIPQVSFLFQCNSPSLCLLNPLTGMCSPCAVVREAFLTRSVWAVQNQSNGQCYGNLSSILSLFCGFRVHGRPVPHPFRGERETGMWHSEIWSSGVQSSYGGKTKLIKKKLFSCILYIVNWNIFVYFTS